jgi:plasmid stabilization system protein ParE
MVSIIWTETASDDIESIRKYISRDSAFYANQFIKKSSIKNTGLFTGLMKHIFIF